jgi:hypothetical protein
MKYMIIPTTFLPKKFQQAERDFLWDIYYLYKMDRVKSLRGASKTEESTKQYQFSR